MEYNFEDRYGNKFMISSYITKYVLGIPKYFYKNGEELIDVDGFALMKTGKMSKPSIFTPTKKRI